MSKTSMNTSGRVCEKLLTGWNQFWLHVTTVRLLLCGRTLSRLAGGNFTACKQDWETAAQSTPEGCSLQPNQRKHVSLHLFRHTRTHCECEQEVTFICWGETENTWTFRIEIDTPPWHGQLLFPASDLMPLTQHFLLFSFFCCHSFSQLDRDVSRGYRASWQPRRCWSDLLLLLVGCKHAWTNLMKTTQHRFSFSAFPRRIRWAIRGSDAIPVNLSVLKLVISQKMLKMKESDQLWQEGDVCKRTWAGRERKCRGDRSLEETRLLKHEGEEMEAENETEADRRRELEEVGSMST